MTSTNLTLQENECAGLRNNVSAELSKEEVDHVDIALVDWQGVGLEKAFRGLCACLTGAENVCEKLHDDRLSRGDDVFGPGIKLAESLQHKTLSTYSDSLKAW